MKKLKNWGLLLLLVILMAGCSSQKNGTGSSGENESGIAGLTLEKTSEPRYAEGYTIYYYEEGYKMIDVHEDVKYLLILEGKEVPEDLDKGIVVLQMPLDHIYLAATSTMALFDAVDSLDCIRLSGTEADGWYIENAREAMESGEILFAGKYSEPDYELLLDEACDLAIESTMIYHTPKVEEMLENIGIPVFVDYSSYEEHPLGRTEWIKVYGALTDKDEEAEAFFEEQAKVIDELKDFQNTEKKVAFFYISTTGQVVVRKTDDYIPAMIEIAGGRYAFDHLENTESNSPSVNMTMEEFYAYAVDADYLIYNATIDNQITSIDELIGKSELFKDFKAVQNGNVWCTGKYLYQATDIVGQLITDIHYVITENDTGEMTFLYEVQE